MTSKKTGLVYSTRCQEHNTGRRHPESPARTDYVYQFLKKTEIFNDLLLLQPKPATIKQIQMIHTEAYIDHVKKTCRSGERLLDSIDTAVSEGSFDAARLASGAAIGLVDSVMNEKIRNGFSLMRPPGHHAERDKALGFCIFNHVAIAAKYVQQKYGLKRILIIDWDVHHGNGTQHAFENDPSVFFFSTHQYPYYPGTGSQDETGIDAGAGTTLNVPLPAGSGDSESKHIWEQIFYLKASQFKPEFIFISAGFDAHRQDPLAHINLSDEMYGWLTDRVLALARENGHDRVVSILEGGYHLDAISRSIYIHLKHLMAAS